MRKPEKTPPGLFCDIVLCRGYGGLHFGELLQLLRVGEVERVARAEKNFSEDKELLGGDGKAVSTQP